nr:hypothetical protein [uncultured Flavobacterium sp.]
MTQLVLYSQQLVRNNKFTLLSSYEWEYTGAWTKEAGRITKTAGVGTLTQSSVFTLGVTYELKYTISGSIGSGNVTVSDGVNTIHNGSTNGTYTIEFTADGTDLIFTTNSTFNASISNVNVAALPTVFKLDIDSQIPFKFSIEDIFEVGKRKAPRTGSFIIKGTSEVNRAFRHIYLINANSVFNPNIKSKCTLISQGIEWFSGTLCLDEIVEKLDSNKGVTDIEYNVSIVESVTDIYSVLGEKTVRDLDFSEYDHAFQMDSATRSWFGDVDLDGVATDNTIINNTFTVTAKAAVVAGGLNRIQFTFSTNHNFTVGQEVYVTPNISECDSSGGANYLFHQVVYSIPAANSIILECSEPCAPYSGALPLNVTSVSDKMFAGFGYYYPCVDNGTYTKTAYPSPVGSGLLESGQTYIISYWDGSDDFTNIGAATNATGEVFLATGTTPNVWISSIVNKLRDTTLTIGTDKLNSKYGNLLNDISLTDSTFEIYDFVPYLFIREILIKSFQLADVEYDCELFDSKVFRSLITPMNDPYTLVEGATLQMNNWTPPMKLKDILNSILNMFNLSMTQKGKVITFINRGEYFDNIAVDWSSKVDISEPLKLTMLNKDGSKIYHFKHSDSKDYINTQFSSDYGGINNSNGLINIKDRNYGDYIIDLITDYKSETKEVLTMFEPSILAGGGNEVFTGIQGLSCAIMPMVFEADKARDNLKRNYSSKILIASPRWVSRGNSAASQLDFVSAVTPSICVKNSWYYGYASHFDNPFQVTPTHDLNFYSPLGIYFNEYVSCSNFFNNTTDLNDSDWANNSLYLKYWSRYIEQITSTNSKKVSGKFKLSLIDVYSLDFSKPVIVGDLKLKLISVDDWHLDSDGLCNVEFLITR